jgi:hypothetical protein
MVDDSDRAERLHRHHVDVLTRIEAQLRRDQAAIREFDLVVRKPDIAPERPEVSSSRSVARLKRVEAAPERAGVASRGRGHPRHARSWPRAAPGGIRTRRQARPTDSGPAAPDQTRAENVGRGAAPPFIAQRPPPLPRFKPGETQVAPGCEDTDRLLRQSADIAEEIADSADTFASFLEQTVARGDDGRRQRVAAAERQVAITERRNAAKLRDRQSWQTPLRLERLSHLPDEHRSEDAISADTESVCRAQHR